MFAVPGFHQLPGLVRRGAYHFKAATLVADAVGFAFRDPEQKLLSQIVVRLSADIPFFRTPNPEILEIGLLPKNPRRPFVEFLLDNLFRRPFRSQQNDLAGWIYRKYPLIPTLWMIFEDSTFAFRSGDKHRSRRIYGK